MLFTNRVAVPFLVVALMLFVFIFILVPFVFRCSQTLQRGILFLNFSGYRIWINTEIHCLTICYFFITVTYPKGLDLTNPSSIGLYATRNFYLTVKDHDEDPNGVQIGVWHVLPKNAVRRFKRALDVEHEFDEDESARLSETNAFANQVEDNQPQLQELMPVLNSEFPVVVPENEQLFYERLLRVPGGVVVIYLHGNTATRGSGHRSEVYKLLRNLNYHVIAFDYRGYADSDRVTTTEEGVVRDAITVFEYVANQTPNPIFIWGHSLGTGVATHMLAKLADLKERGPRGVILESPFTNIRDEIRLHPFSRPFRSLPWFDFMISQPMFKNNLRFESDKHIYEFPQPVMIVHAEDDVVVPFHLGYQLYRIALEKRNRSWGPVEFHRFERSHGYGHKYLCRAPEIPKLVKGFVDNYHDAVY